ncbi:MAG: ATP-binding cassette domain-containing protein [Anaerosacchariphilus sp.]
MEALEMVGLLDHAEHRPTELSGGQQQRISIARAIITRPGIIFADEPTGNLDSRTGNEIMDLLTGLFRQWGATFLVVSHDEDMNRYTDREVRLKDGKIEKIIL